MTKTLNALLVCAALAYAQKNYQPGEFDAYNAVVKDIVANDFTKALTDLDAWAQQHPKSDYAPDRDVLYMKAYVSAKCYGQAVDKAGELLAKGLDTAFPDPKGALQILYNATVAITSVVNPTPRQVETGG